METKCLKVEPIHQPTLFQMEKLGSLACLRVGTSAFTANGWQGSFYPAGMKPADYLKFYSSKFQTVEIDST